MFFSLRFFAFVAIAILLASCKTISSLSGGSYHPDEKLIAQYKSLRPVPISYDTKGKAQLLLQLGHSDFINAVDYSPDGKFIATAGKDGSTKLWNATTGEELLSYGHLNNAVKAIKFSPDGKYIVTANYDASTVVFDTQTAAVVHTFEQQGSAGSIKFTPDGRKVITSSADDTIKIWDPLSGEVYLNYNEHSAATKFDISPNGKLIASLNGKSWGLKKGEKQKFGIRIWDSQSGKTRHVIDSEKEIRNISFSPDGRYIAATIGGSFSMHTKINLWDVYTGKRLKQLTGHEGSHGQVVGKKRVGLRKGVIDGIIFSPDGKTLFSAGGKSIKQWDINSGRVVKSFSGHQDDILGLSVSADGKNLVSGGRDNVAKIWQINAGKNTLTLKGNSSKQALSVATSPNKNTSLSAYYDGTFSLLNLETGKKIRSAKGHSGPIHSIAYSPNGTLFTTASEDGKVKLWNAQSFRLMRTFNGHRGNGGAGGALSAKFSPSGRYIVSGGFDNTLKVWDVETGTLLRKFKPKSSKSFSIRTVHDVAFSSNEALVASANFGNSVTVWNVHSSEVIYQLSGHNDDVTAVEFSPNHKYLASAAGHNILSVGRGFDNSIKLWSVERGNEIKTFKGHSGSITSIAFSADSTSLISGSDDRTIRVWDVPSGVNTQVLKGHTAPVTSVKYSRDGRYIISTSKDTSTKMWNAATGQEIISMYSTTNDEWLTITPDYYFDASENGSKLIKLVSGINLYEIDQFQNEFYRPDVVQARINFNNDVALHELAQAKPRQAIDQVIKQVAPNVNFITPPSSRSAKRDINLTIKISDMGGGVGKVLWRINGLNVGVEELGRGLKKVPSSNPASHAKLAPIEHTKQLSLSPGKNIIEVVVYNKANSMASLPQSLTLNLKDDISEVPSLHILAVGVNRYRDKSLWLNYAVPDVKGLTSHFEESGYSIYKEINITQVLDSEATSEGIQKAFEKIAKQAKTNDVFIFYVAGHGVTLDGRYHFLPVDFRYRNEDSVRQKAVNQDHIQKWMSSVQARKSLILLDTCNSGSYVDAQAVARGISEKTAIDKLIRATGRTTISASTDTQVALEGINNHGVFTYALMKGLEQADKDFGNRDGVVSTTELASFIDEMVPELTYKKWGYEQVPQVNLHGRPFPIGLTVQ